MFNVLQSSLGVPMNPSIRPTRLFALLGGMLSVSLPISHLWFNAPVQAQRSPQQMAQKLTISPKFSPDPIRLQGLSGGSVPMRVIAGRTDTSTGPCVGFADTKPDHTLELSSFFNYLSLQLNSSADTTLVIQGPGGIWCNDDVFGKNPGIAGQWLPGTYKIWVGSYEKTKYLPYTLQITASR